MPDEMDVTWVAPVNKDLKRFVPPYGDYNERGFILEEGTVEPGKKSVWQLDAFRMMDRPTAIEVAAVYFSCPRCTKVSADLETYSRPIGCLVCNNCGRHLWLKYDGWTAEKTNEFNQRLHEQYRRGRDARKQAKY